MHFVLATLLSLSVSVLAGCPNLEKRDNHPGGAAAIESAVTSAFSATNLPPDLATLGPALSSAGITGVVVSDSTYGTSQPTGTSNGNNNNNNDNNDQNGQDGQNGQNGESNNDQGNSTNDQGNSNNDQGNSNNDNNNGQSSGSRNGNGGSRTTNSDNLSPATAVPQVLMAGAFGAVGMAVLGML